MPDVRFLMHQRQFLRSGGAGLDGGEPLLEPGLFQMGDYRFQSPQIFHVSTGVMLEVDGVINKACFHHPGL